VTAFNAESRPAAAKLAADLRAGGVRTELYMQDDSPWIGSTIADLALTTKFEAGVIGVRKADGHYHYAPSLQFTLKRQEVLIVVTPMKYADELRTLAHGSVTRRPTSLRTGRTGKLPI